MFREFNRAIGRMRARTSIVMALTALTLTASAPAGSEGQNPARAEVVRAAVHALRAGGHLPEGPLTIDPRALRFDQGSLGFEGRAVPERAERLAQAVGDAAVARIDENVDCASERPTRCTLRHGVAAVAVSDVVMGDGRAVIYFHIRAATHSARQPVSSADLRVRLTEIDGKWQAGGITVLRIS